jgi:endogenous inhibitor of DNA gyrase (YacG/DUF329 family)
MEVERIADWPAFPFCSSKCKLVDLGRWLGETYRVPHAGPDALDVEATALDPDGV